MHIMEKEKHERWLSDLIEPDSMRTAADKAGYTQTTISRQLAQGELNHELVIALSRTYDHSPVIGLIETGYIEPWETEGVSIPYTLKQTTNQQILDEIMRRSDPEARALFTAVGDPDTVDLADDTDATVYYLPERGDDEMPDTAVTYRAQARIASGRS